MNHGPPNVSLHLENLSANLPLGAAGHPNLGLGTVNFIAAIDPHAGASPVVNA